LGAILRPNALKDENGSGAESPKPLYLQQEIGCGGLQRTEFVGNSIPS
jgi:hypothetical protein